MKDIKLSVFLIAIVAMISLCGCEYLETEVADDGELASSSSAEQDEDKDVTLEDVQAEIKLESNYNKTGLTSEVRVEFKAFGTGNKKTVLPFWLYILVAVIIAYYLAHVLIFVGQR